MITVVLYENHIRAILDLIEQDEFDDQPQFLALRGAHRRLTVALDSMPGQPLDEDLDRLNAALMSLRAGNLRDLLLDRIQHVNRIAAIWRGCESLPIDLQRRFLRVDRIDDPQWAKDAVEELANYGLRTVMPRPAMK